MTKSELTKLLELEWDRGWNEAWNIAFEAGRADAATKLMSDAVATAASNERLAMGAIQDLNDVHNEMMERASAILEGLTKTHKAAISSWLAFSSGNTLDPTAKWSEAKKAAKERREGPIHIPLKKSTPHTLWKAEDFDHGDADVTSSKLYQMVIDGGLDVCKHCRAYEQGLIDFPTCEEFTEFSQREFPL